MVSEGGRYQTTMGKHNVIVFGLEQMLSNTALLSSSSSSSSLLASSLAFDHYGQLTQQLEDQAEMREKAEQLAVQVTLVNTTLHSYK